MNSLYGAGITALGNITSNTLGSVFGNLMAERREKIARQENYMYNEWAASHADTRTRRLYQDLYSPQAQMKQIKEAGLSPSMYFGDMAGISGQTGAQGAGATGISPTSFGISPIDLAAINKMAAETEKIKEETKTEKGENQRGAAEINNIIESTNNVVLKNVWQEYANSLEEIQMGVEASLQEKKVENYIRQTEYLAHITKSAAVKADIDEKSENDVLNYLHEKTLNVAADTLLKKTQKLLGEAQIKLTNQQCADLISQITTREGTLKLQGAQLDAQIKQWGITNGLTEKLNDAKIKEISNEIAQGWTGKVLDLLKLVVDASMQ